MNEGTERGKSTPKEMDRETTLRTPLRMFWENGSTPITFASLWERLAINSPVFAAMPTIADSLDAFLEGPSLQDSDGLFLCKLPDLPTCAIHLLSPEK